MVNKYPHVAVVGAGYWGKNLVRNYHELGALKIICDKEETLLASFKKQYPDAEICSSLNDVLTRQDVEAVVIATPAEEHFHLVQETLLGSKNVWVEKPLALNEREGTRLVALAQERGLTLMVGHHLQYHPTFVHLKELVARGELGRINYIYSSRLNLGKIRREENILWSFAPHDISMILSLAGEQPQCVIATGGNYLHQRIADVTTTHLEFPSGFRAHIFVSWLHPYKEQKLIVVGDRKMAVFDDTQPWPDKLLLYSHEIKWQHNIPVPVKAEPERPDIPQAEPLRLACMHFLECISRGKQPLTDGHEGLNVLKVLNASQRSLDEYGTRVYLQEDLSKRSLRSLNPYSANLPKQNRPISNSYFIHETSFIDDNVSIGEATTIWHFSHILANTKIGERCNIGQNVVIGPEVTIGNGCKIQNNVSVYKGVTLENDVFCGPSMVFTNVYNPRAHIRRISEIRPTLVKKGATLGANCTIICGATIGQYAFVGGGAVVTKNVPDHALVVGNPARQIGWVCECGERLSDDMKCVSCRNTYEKVQDGIREMVRFSYKTSLHGQ